MMDRWLGVAIGGLVVLVVALIWFTWWVTGVILDWANFHFALGLSGTPYLAVHIVMFLILGSIGGGSGASSRKDS